jgi:hypothetical protein
MFFFDILRHLFCIKTRLCRKKLSGYWQELSMLFPKHACFILIGIKTNEWQLAKCSSILDFGMPAAIHSFDCLSIKSRGGLETAWIALAPSLIQLLSKALFTCAKCI